MKKKILITAFFACVLCLYISNAQAELIEISLSATVNYVEDIGNKLEGQIHTGSIITGYYSYESTTLDSNPSSQVGDYWHYSQPYGIFLTVGGFEFKTDLNAVNFLIEITDNYPPDGYYAISYNNLPLSDTVSVGSISWWLSDSTATVFSNDVLPVTAPVLSQWQTNSLSIYGAGADDFFIEADVTSVQLVPEPGTLLLLALGSFILRKRNSN